MTIDLEGMRAAAEKATPGDLDTVPNPPSEYGGHSSGVYKCPACDGQGEVDGASYCNFDGVALGVQFFGIGNEHVNYEAYFRAVRPAAVLALLDYVERLKTPLMQTVEAVRAYLPPDGIEPHEFISRVIEAIDNPQINPIIKDIENGRS